MKHTYRFTRLTAGMLLLVFMLSFALPTIVLADDTVPAEPTVPAEAPAAPVEAPVVPT